MGKRHFQLTAQEQGELLMAYESTSNVHEQRGYQVVRLYGDGWSTRAIREATGYSRTSITRLVKRYQEEGVAGLGWRQQGGNRALLSAEQQTELQETVKNYRPDQLMSAAERRHAMPFWTVAALRVWIERKYGITFASDTSYRQLLHQCGLSRQRVTTQYRSRPAWEVVVEAEALLEKK